MSKSTKSRAATKEARAGKTKATTTQPSGTKAKSAKAQATTMPKPTKSTTKPRKPRTPTAATSPISSPRDVAPDSAQQPTRAGRPDTKQARLIAMLEREEGASIAEIVTAFSWQAHTVRGTIAGALKKKLGLAITSDKVEGRARVYRIANG